MSLAKNKAFVDRMTEEFWNAGNLTVVDEFYAVGFCSHDPNGTMDLEQFKQQAAAYFVAFPDLNIITDDLVAEGDKVVKRWTAHCTHKGELMGIPPTGKQITVTGLEMFRLAGGKIVEIWSIMDSLGMMQQIGVIPPMG